VEEGSKECDTRMVKEGWKERRKEGRKERRKESEERKL
jgi:hypothetical protein